MRIRDPGWRQFGSRIRGPGWKKVGSGINIPDPQHWVLVQTMSSYRYRVVPTYLYRYGIAKLFRQKSSCVGEAEDHPSGRETEQHPPGQDGRHEALRLRHLGPAGGQHCQDQGRRLSALHGPRANW
jgi:hypothetical protein